MMTRSPELSSINALQQKYSVQETTKVFPEVTEPCTRKFSEILQKEVEVPVLSNIYKIKFSPEFEP
jgi:hypothetical protein